MADLNVSNSDLEEIFGIKLVGKGQEVPKDVAKDFKLLTDELKQTTVAASGLSTETQKLDTSLKKTVGDEAGGTGFAGLATNVLKAERAINALVSGNGLARAGPLLEGVMSAIGGPAGLASAFIAMELGARVLGPTIEKFVGAIGQDSADRMKAFAESVKRLREEGQKLAASPLVKAEEAAAKHFLEAGRGEELHQGLVNALQKQGFGLTEQERDRVKSGTDAATQRLEAQGGRLGQEAFQRRMVAEDLLVKSYQASEAEALKMIARLGQGDVRAQVEAERILGDVGKAMMQKLRERMEAAVIQRKAEIAKEDFVGPPAPPPKTADQKLHDELMEMARAEDAANQRRHGQAATDRFLKDVANRAATKVGQGQNKNAAMQEAIDDAQEAQRAAAEAEAKKKEQRAIRSEMQRRGIHGTPEQEDMVLHDALRSLPQTAGNIQRAVQMGYMEAIRQMHEAAHKQNRNLGNSFQQQGGPW